MASNLAYTYDRVNDMHTTTINNAQRDLEKLIGVTLNEDMVTIATDDGNVVMISEFEFRSIMETLDIYNHPSYMKTIVDAANEPPEGCVSLKDVWPDVFDSIYKTGPEGR